MLILEAQLVVDNYMQLSKKKVEFFEVRYTNKLFSVVHLGKGSYNVIVAIILLINVCSQIYSLVYHIDLSLKCFYFIL